MRRLILLLFVALACVACAPAAPSIPIADLPEGDAAAGEVLFYEKIGGLSECSYCHSIDGVTATGPSLLNFGANAASRIPEQDAITYTYNSIVSPGAHVVRGYSNLMPALYSQHLNRQQIADLIAYLLSL